MTIHIRNEKPANKLLIEDVEWDEEHLKSLHITKEQALKLFQTRGYDFQDFEYIGTITVPSGVTPEDFGESVETINDNDFYLLDTDDVMECPGNTFKEKLDNYTIRLFQEGKRR